MPEKRPFSLDRVTYTVQKLASDLASGKTSARALAEEALARIADSDGEGSRAFVHVDADGALEMAGASDTLRKRGQVRSPIEGLPISVKDLFNVEGQVTRAGSKLLAGAPPAESDAVVIQRLRAAGAVLLGRTNMVEFAFGGVGLNPHMGTPRNPWERTLGRVPGGSSSGAGVAQAQGMGVMALGTDTRGSVRIPAALCGVVGFKPTAQRVPTQGAFPLSKTLDSVGPLANSVNCCAIFDAVLSGASAPPLQPLAERPLRLLVPEGSLLEGLDEAVARAFEKSLSQLSRAGAKIVSTRVPCLEAHPRYFAGGGIAGFEAYAVHHEHLEKIDLFDPRVRQRIALGAAIRDTEYTELLHLRRSAIESFSRTLSEVDGLLLPTVPCLAPTIHETDLSDEAYSQWNLKLLRNAGVINFLDGCAITVPCQEPGTAPVGLMVCSAAGRDWSLLSVSAHIESVLQPT